MANKKISELNELAANGNSGAFVPVAKAGASYKYNLGYVIPVTIVAINEVGAVLSSTRATELENAIVLRVGSTEYRRCHDRVLAAAIYTEMSDDDERCVNAVFESYWAYNNNEGDPTIFANALAVCYYDGAWHLDSYNNEP